MPAWMLYRLKISFTGQHQLSRNPVRQRIDPHTNKIDSNR